MSAQPVLQTPERDGNLSLRRVARLPHLRALTWSGDQLYASRGYEILRAKIENPSAGLIWQPVAAFHPSWRRQLSSANTLTARLFRDGFHALAVLPSGGLVGAVPGTIVTHSPEASNEAPSKAPNEAAFRPTHAITRGTRPLHITAVPDGAIYWGEYFDNASRDEVHVYSSIDGGATWNVAYTFLKGAIRHVHNIVFDPWENCLWVLTGDYGDECRILRATCDFTKVETVLQGNQQARAVALVPMRDALYFASDTPLESNFIYRLDRSGALSPLAAISSSSISACRVGDNIFFSTMVEPSEVNRDRQVRIYGSNCGANYGTNVANGNQSWSPLLSWHKDRWPMGLFQYGNAFFPGGDNITPYLAVTTIAVESDDRTTSLYEIVR